MMDVILNFVSIHAPTRGATVKSRWDIIHRGCFNPRTYTRCDLAIFLYLPVLIGFNPRTYTRCDFVRFLYALFTIEFQSTHLHEVRLQLPFGSFQCLLFQSTHLHEVRLPLPNTPYAGDVFQSTHLHEVRLLASVLFDTTTPSFNPRTYTRCDGPSAFIGRHSSIVSIHAPTRGATYSTASFWLPIVVFQSTHLHEVRLCVYLHKITIMEVSIHAPTRGATLMLMQLILYITVSIHAPTRGATRFIY